MLRAIVAVVTSASFIAATSVAPMTHVHGDGERAGGHHHGGVIHAHADMHVHAARSSHPAAWETAGEHSNESARAINVFQADGSSGGPVVALIGALTGLVAPVARAGVVVAVSPRSHDPPASRSLHPRAPPARLS